MPDYPHYDGSEPFLFDRLANRQRLAVDRVSGGSRGISSRSLREIVSRDLISLLSTCALEAVEDLEAYPRIQKSVLNFGLPGLLQDDGRGPTPDSVARLVQTAIERFEPRLSQVRVTHDGDQDGTSLKMRITAQLLAPPNAQRFEIDLAIDVISGAATARTAGSLS